MTGQSEAQGMTEISLARREMALACAGICDDLGAAHPARLIRALADEQTRASLLPRSAAAMDDAERAMTDLLIWSGALCDNKGAFDRLRKCGVVVVSASAHGSLVDACRQAKDFLIKDLEEPGRTVFWTLVRALKLASAS